MSRTYTRKTSGSRGDAMLNILAYVVAVLLWLGLPIAMLWIAVWGVATIVKNVFG